MSDSFATFFAQVTNTATGIDPNAPVQVPPQPLWVTMAVPILIVAMLYFALIRPQTQAKKKQEETIKSAKTGDKVVTTSGIHGVITNVKDTTVIVKVADNVKLEIEKSHIDKIVRSDAAGSSESDKVAVTKV